MDVTIPTRDRPNTINMVLSSLAFQTRLPDKIIVFDSGQRSIFVDFSCRLAWDLCSRKNIEMVYLRQIGLEGVTLARIKGLEQVNNNFMILDDDILLEPNYIEVLEKHLKNYDFATGLILLPNNEMYKKDFEIVCLDEIPSVMKKNQYAYFEYNKSISVEVDYGNIGATLFSKRVLSRVLEGYSKLNKRGNLDDWVVTKKVGNGLFDTSVTSWHLMSIDQSRQWEDWVDTLLRDQFEENPELITELMCSEYRRKKQNDTTSDQKKS